MKTLIGLFVGLLLSGCATSQVAYKPAPAEIQPLIDKYKLNAYTLDVTLMPAWTRTDRLPVRKAGVVFYRMPKEEETYTGFTFDLFYDPSQGVYWVKRTTGGLEEKEENFGPIRL